MTIAPTRTVPAPGTLREADVAPLLERLGALEAEIGKVVVGQRETVRHVLVTLLAGGHALLEGAPGLGKTLLVRTLSQALELAFKRIQFTPDLMPSDILGSDLLEEDPATGKRRFRFQPGPIFANLVLADEINRSPPKTQAALLEAMQEGEVTVAGETRPLSRPFFVLATQNPIEQAGTYPLPEAQLDRFLLYLRVAYPSAEEELEIVAATTGTGSTPIDAVIDGEALMQAQTLARQVHVSEPLAAWATRLVRASRPGGGDEATPDVVREAVAWGAGPRAAQSMVLAAKACALLDGRFAVGPQDLREVALPVMRHRLVLGFRGQAEGVDTDDVVRALLDAVPEPTSPLAD